MKVTAKIQGGAQLQRNLRALVRRMNQDALYRVLMQAGEPIRDQASSNVARGDEAPHVADHIVMKIIMRPGELATLAIGPAKNVGVAYGLPLEIGTWKAPAQPYLRPAFDSEKSKAMDVAGDAAWNELMGEAASMDISGGASEGDE